MNAPTTTEDAALIAECRAREAEHRRFAEHSEANRDGWYASMPPEISESAVKDADFLTRLADRLDALSRRSKGEGEDETCIACELPINPGDPYYPDVSGGNLHAECTGPEGFATAEGDPLQEGDPIPHPSIWQTDDQFRRTLAASPAPPDQDARLRQYEAAIEGAVKALELAEDVLARSPFSTQLWPNGMHPNTGITSIRETLAELRAVQGMGK